MTRAAPLLAALAGVGVLLLAYAALGGGSYAPTPVADPCVTREWRDPAGLDAALEQLALSALDGAACELGVSREELVLALRSESSLDEFASEHDISRADAERAVEESLERAVDDAVEAGALPDLVATLVRRTIEAVPPWLLLDLLERLQQLLP